ncbi:hypothetical protein ACNFJ7_04130 [Sphingomonas sp. HT-1]|uniref:hypothetical protein n=1 Tax=unclassified Sphingomonas TaxID=196159 RepID=UPI0003150566|nr:MULTISPECIES: hypothetical protein [unclassified Sphingomonas]KTF67290.1 hypothetical protein ATB93_18365 [Sphingomonas sp. WG]
MTKLRLMAAAVALMPLAACGGGESNVADSSNYSPEANAMIYQDGSDNAANAEAEAMIGNASNSTGADAMGGNSN